MKQIISVILFLFVSTSAKAQFDFSLRDTRYASAGYTLNNRWLFRFESSLFNADENHQNFFIYTGYKKTKRNFEAVIQQYFGLAWNASYMLAGLKLCASYSFSEKVKIEGIYNPHWDSMYGFKNCYRASIEVPVTQEISFISRYQNIPEYRIPANRIRIGMHFHVKNLSVIPEFSFAANHILKPMRVMVGLLYTFNNN